jgi:hypothetical protein
VRDFGYKLGSPTCKVKFETVDTDISLARPRNYSKGKGERGPVDRTATSGSHPQGELGKAITLGLIARRWLLGFVRVGSNEFTSFGGFDFAPIGFEMGFSTFSEALPVIAYVPEERENSAGLNFSSGTSTGK